MTKANYYDIYSDKTINWGSINWPQLIEPQLIDPQLIDPLGNQLLLLYYLPVCPTYLFLFLDFLFYFETCWNR